MGKRRKTLELPLEIANRMEEYRDESFRKFFKSAVEETLQKKSIYDIMKLCFKAGYFSAMKETAGNGELHKIAEAIAEETKKQTQR